jgi:hypothetical protein
LPNTSGHQVFLLNPEEIQVNIFSGYLLTFLIAVLGHTLISRRDFLSFEATKQLGDIVCLTIPILKVLDEKASSGVVVNACVHYFASLRLDLTRLLI